MCNKNDNSTPRGVNILSLFDGMACGMLAFLGLGIKPKNYYAYEIDKYAIKTTEHNFPNIKQCGDVFKANFAQYEGIDYLIGGSPCTYWSIAQSPDKRETTASGLGWELFSQYIRALKEAKPKYFLYENNKSMSKAIYKSISDSFGFEPILINSALVSAQNRNRYYWCGKRNDDRTYSKVDIPQPEDRGILLRDILEGNDLTCGDKSYTVTASYNGAVPWNTIERHQRNMVAEPVGTTKDGKSYCLTSGYSNGSGEKIGNYVTHTLEKGCKSMVTESVRVGALPRPNGELSTSQAMRVYSIDGKTVNLCAGSGGMGGKTGLYIAINKNAIRGVQDKNNASCAENFYEFTDTKANTLTTAHKPKIIDELSNYYPYAEPCEWDDNGNPTKAISYADGKTYIVYSVIDGQIEIKSKIYPIKLKDGYYIIRKLTVKECMKLQTVPEWYDFSAISNSQAYKCLGNGWTVEVIKHLLRYCMNE